MDASKTNQNQKAGEGAVQSQVIGNGTIYTDQSVTNVTNIGMTPDQIATFTATVSTQVMKQALSFCTEIAAETAKARMSSFEEKWMPRLSKMESIEEKLQDPKFQFMIRDANITAAKSDREDDLNVLSELLACHIEKGSDRKVDAGISRAISIVNEIDNDALCALTLVAAILKVMPNSGNIGKGLAVIDELYSKLIYIELPEGDAWIDHVNVLGCASISSLKFLPFQKLFCRSISGYACVGIQKDSESHTKAIEILTKNGYSESVLVPNELLDGYLRLPVSDLYTLKEVLKPIESLYSKDSELQNRIEKALMDKVGSYGSILKAKEWFDRLPVSIGINSIGLALAQTNAKRCYANFPDLI